MQGIFFGGLEPSMRHIVWPFLLHCFTFQSTYEEREQILEIRHQEYHEITWVHGDIQNENQPSNSQINDRKYLFWSLACVLAWSNICFVSGMLLYIYFPYILI